MGYKFLRETAASTFSISSMKKGTAGFVENLADNKSL